MYTYSKKSRRRMHAIPAAIALTCLVIFWFLSGHSRVQAEVVNTPVTNTPATTSTTLLSSDNTWQWELDCYDCVVEPQYDVIHGNVVRLQSRQELVLSTELGDELNPSEWANPELSWRWTVDRYVERQPLMRLTLKVKETDSWPSRTLHYVWHSGLAAGESEVLSDFEHLLVVSGKTSKAESWQAIQRNLNQDWQEIYEENFPGIESLELALGMPGESGGTGGFIQQLVIAGTD
ncbi:DUF3047 domain-containing protein [Bacterioplanoides sp. SCSIO 12839]|uniref:DUF3047 domain-containing protein n=1 Tax=Bacterioplanoides sp. SCSIO 12839 TaxID=2829569 RepID=UPI0021024838|nr:DUF3047 domain-containing protein [Bacterioplanoides sp. SCSIO 12839]UTW48067.1 DUF3047 domain-containing protein [Bacterioplanoides sp. SCSIO 12839]